jgi:hypothetical protein
MERWVSSCEKCSIELTNSQVAGIFDHFTPITKLEFPKGGLRKYGVQHER